MKRWIGRWLIVVASMHTIFGVFGFGVVPMADSLDGIFADGFVNSLREDTGRWVIIWFLLFGFLLFILGLLLDWAEMNDNRALPASLGWSMIALIVTGALLIPVEEAQAILMQQMA
ncbi:MAG: DUF6463 family protein [bacterium]